MVIPCKGMKKYFIIFQKHIPNQNLFTPKYEKQGIGSLLYVCEMVDGTWNLMEIVDKFNVLMINYISIRQNV